jgi:hypothetical protein
VAERAGAEAPVSEEREADSSDLASRFSRIVSPGGSAAGEKQVLALEGEGVGQDGRLSDGHDGHRGGEVSRQQPAGIAAVEAGQIASIVRAAPTGSIPATSASATKRRADTACRSRIERMLSKIRASRGTGLSRRRFPPRRETELSPGLRGPRVEIGLAPALTDDVEVLAVDGIAAPRDGFRPS